MVPMTIDKDNRLIYYGNPIGYVPSGGGSAVVDPVFKSDDLMARLDRFRLSPKWESGVYGQLTSGQPQVNVMSSEASPLKRCRVWQLKPNTDMGMRFIDYDTTVKNYGAPKRENYRQVYDGQLGTNDLEEIYNICNTDVPSGYGGWAMSMSDVVELYDDGGSEFFYCDRTGFRTVQFASMEQTQCESQEM